MNSDQVTSHLSRNVTYTSCQDMVARGPALAHSMGYGTDGRGIAPGSLAAQGMSIEARANGGGVPSMRDGGVSAALQSIGDSGYVKPEAARSIHGALIRGGIKGRGSLTY